MCCAMCGACFPHGQVCGGAMFAYMSLAVYSAFQAWCCRGSPSGKCRDSRHPGAGKHVNNINHLGNPGYVQSSSLLCTIAHTTSGAIAKTTSVHLDPLLYCISLKSKYICAEQLDPSPAHTPRTSGVIVKWRFMFSLSISLSRITWRRVA